MAGFEGYLLRFGDSPNGVLPLHFLEMSSYEVNPNQRIEKEAFRDANGNLHRSTIPNFKTKITFTVKSINNNQKSELFYIFNTNRDGSWNESQRYMERMYYIRYWDIENNDYRAGEFYMVDPQYKILRIDSKNNLIYYEPIKYTFIQY